MRMPLSKTERSRLSSEDYDLLWRLVLERDSWRCQSCGRMDTLHVHHIQFRSQQGSDCEENMITLCAACHKKIHCG
jgi:5-methylcytosine-specific restriction endonuclease McrA